MPRAGPTTFLFTDVEGSTRLWEQDRDGMAASLAQHDRILGTAITSHHGRVFSTAGDAFAAAFPTPGDAADAALAIQTALVSARWKGPELAVRIGLHTGEAEERDGDYFGPVLNRAARIMAAGHGGQTLLSSAAAAAVADTLPAPAALGDLGTHRLKDLDDPEHLYELRHPDLPPIERPIRTLDVRRHNLPDYLSTFVGRTAELDALDGALEEHRLVVLTGVGGTGKTRLAVEAAHRRADRLPDGAWLVELAPVTRPDLVMAAVGETWGLRPGEGATITDVVTRYLWSRQMLLVVDNCEHLIEPAADAISRILDACPGITILATSRESLGIGGEIDLHVPSLSLPGGSGTGSEAVRLFLDRAATIRPGYRPSGGDAAAIARICTRIDGIPLGIELAAARLRSMSPVEVADRLDGSFGILSGAAKSAVPRQRTLQATIDWSHDLLTPPEATLFRRLAVFVDGFDLTAAEAVCGGDGIDPGGVAGLVDSLVDKSLVLAGHGPTTRFRLLEPIRQYARERLADSGEADGVAAAHALHYAALVAEAAPHTRGPGQMPWERRLDADYDNIRAAFAAMLRTGDVDRYLSTGFDLFIYWMHLGMHLEGVETLLAGIEAAPPGTDPHLLLKAWFCVVGLGAEITDPKAIEHGRRMLALAETMDDPNALGRAELQLGAAIRHSTTDPEYLQHLEAARSLLEAHPEPFWWEPDWETAVLNLVLAAYLPPDDARILEHVTTAIDLFESTGDDALLAATLADSLGLWGRADEEWLVGNLRKSVAILSGMQVPYWYGHALMTYGSLLTRQHAYRDAVPLLAEAAVHLGDCGDVNCWATSSRALAQCEAELGDPERAARRTAEVIESLPILPMIEVHVPRTLDTAAHVLERCGRPHEAALLLGKAVATEFPVATIWSRDDLQQQIRSALVEDLGTGDVDRLGAEGAASDARVLLRQAAAWLTKDRETDGG